MRPFNKKYFKRIENHQAHWAFKKIKNKIKLPLSEKKGT